MVTSGNLEEAIELVKKVTVYGEDKGGSIRKKAAKGVRANGPLMVDQWERSKSFTGTPSRRSLPMQ